RRASLCPDCYALVPVPPEAPRLPLNVWRGRVSLRGYRVEVADDGLFTHLEIETPAGVERRLEPGRWLTRRGAAVLLAGPPVALAEKAVAAGGEAVERLADLRRLAIHDAAREGEDPVPLVVAEVARCFEGRLSFAYAERLLEGWESDWWTPANLARLRVLLCDRAFEAGFEVRNLLEAGRAAPTLGAVLEAENRRPLAWLRLLWSLRPRRPWDHCGKAVTGFEVAESAEQARLLGDHPDLLLLQEGVGAWGPAAESVLVGGGGLVFGNVLFTERPGQVE